MIFRFCRGVVKTDGGGKNLATTKPAKQAEILAKEEAFLKKLRANLGIKEKTEEEFLAQKKGNNEEDSDAEEGAEEEEKAEAVELEDVEDTFCGDF